MKTFHLTVAKVGENLFDGEAVFVSLPGSEGLFQVLAEHEAFVSELVPGDMHIKVKDGNQHTIKIERKGIAEISHNQVTVLL